MIVKIGETQEETIRRKSIIGFSLKAKLNHTTVNTAFTTIDVDWSKIQVVARLTRGQQTYDLVSDVIGHIGAACQFTKAAYKQSLSQISTNNPLVTLQTQTASLDHIVEVCCLVLLPGIVNVADDDILSFRVTAQQGAFATTVDTAVSVIQADKIEAIGNEWMIPFIKAEAVQPGETSRSYSPGDGIKSVHFINSDKTDVTLTDQVISQISIDSEQENINDNWEELLSKRYDMFENIVNANDRGQSFLLAEGGNGTLLNGVNINVTFNSSNVNSGKNYFVFSGFRANQQTALRASRREQKHNARNTAAIIGQK
jgi:hypothetical protein